MKRRALFAAAVALAVVLVELGPASRRALADNEPQNVLGHWLGFFRGTQNMGTVEFDITDQDHRNFTGMVDVVIEGGLFALPFNFAGTVNANNGFAGTGKGPAGMVNFTYGELQFFPDGAAMGVANYRFKPASGGPQDVGTIMILRGSTFEPNSPPPNVNGIWEGTYTSTVPGGTGPLSLLIMQDTSTGAPAGTSFSGILSVVLQGGMTIDLAFQGTIDAMGQFYAIGQGPAGNIFFQGQVAVVVEGGLTAHGSYAFVSVDGSPNDGMFGITQQR